MVEKSLSREEISMDYEGYGKCERCESSLLPRVVDVSVENHGQSNEDYNFNFEWQRLFRVNGNEKLLCCSKCSFAKRV